jgi:hypothetical protein
MIVTKQAFAAAGLACSALTTAALAAPHVHGVVALDVALEGPRVVLSLKAPLDSLVGFERAPRTDAERRAAADVLARLRQPDALFRLDAAAGCRRVSAEVAAPVLEARPGAAKGSADGHAELEAQIAYDCSQPDALKTLEVGLADTFKRIRRIDVQVAGSRGQFKVTLRGAARSVQLQR